MARGSQTSELDVPALEMTKWFDTNYHYIVPEFTKNQEFKIFYNKIFIINCHITNITKKINIL